MKTGKQSLLPLLLVSFAAITIATFGMFAMQLKTSTMFRTSVPGRTVRWLLGEPGATQGVNDAADALTTANWDEELTVLADQLMDEYGAIASTLPEAEFSSGYSLPLDRLPPKFYELGGSFRHDPDLILRLDDTISTPTAIVLSWGHMRHAIIVYAKPPSVPPQGFFVRQVSDRIYVIANES